MKILIRTQKDKEWQLVASAAYLKEKELHHLLAESPGLIPIGVGSLSASPSASRQSASPAKRPELPLMQPRHTPASKLIPSKSAKNCVNLRIKPPSPCRSATPIGMVHR